MIGVPIRWEETDTETYGKVPSEEKGRVWSKTSTSQGTPTISSSIKTLEKGMEQDAPLKPSEREHNPVYILISDV